MKLFSILLTTLMTASFAAAQVADPSMIAPNFILCSSQSQTQQLIVPMQDENTPVMGQFIVTDAPGSTNVLEMSQLDVINASYSKQSISIDAAGIIDFNLKMSITANAVGEFNITPSMKTLVYIGTLNHSTKGAEGYTCVVLSADELSNLSM